MNYFEILTPNNRIIINPSSPIVNIKVEKSELNLTFSKNKKIPDAAQHLIGWLEKDGDMHFPLQQKVGDEIVKCGICVFEEIITSRNPAFHYLIDIEFIGTFYLKE